MSSIIVEGNGYYPSEEGQPFYRGGVFIYMPHPGKAQFDLQLSHDDGATWPEQHSGRLGPTERERRINVKQPLRVRVLVSNFSKPFSLWILDSPAPNAIFGPSQSERRLSVL